MYGRQISASEIAKMQADLAAIYSPQTGGAGLVMQTGPFGNRLVDQRPDAFWAQITGDGSGSGTSTSGSGVGAGHYYDWKEMVPSFYNGENVLIEKDHGRKGTSDACPAVEANEVQEVPIGTNVWLYPGAGAPDYYLFLWTGEGSGSGGSGTEMTIDCGDGSDPITVTISGSSITVN